MLFMDWVFKAADGDDEAISTFSTWLSKKVNIKKKLIFPDEDNFEKWHAFVRGNAPKGSAGPKIRIAFRAAWSDFVLSRGGEPAETADNTSMYVESSLFTLRKLIRPIRRL